MPITELVFPVYKPGGALAAQSVVRTALLSVLDSTPGTLCFSLGHVLRHKGEDISSEHRSFLGIEWDQPSSFHAFFPESAEFKNFVAQIMPYLAEAPSPKLFQPGKGYERSEAAFASGVTQVFVAKVDEKKEEAQGAWDALIASLKKEESGVREWNGWGIESNDGVWVGLVGWDTAEALDKTTKTESVVESLRKVRGLPGLEEYAVQFQA